MQAATTASKKGSYAITGESVRVSNKAQNTRFHFGADKTLVIAKGMTYCASVLYKLNSGTDSLFLQFETKNSSGAKSYYGSAFKQAQRDIALDNGWKLRWAAFTATADGYADGLFVSTADDNATVTNDLTIMHPMVQMGNAPTAWTASSGDYLTTTETKTEIKQTVSEIKLTAIHQRHFQHHQADGRRNRDHQRTDQPIRRGNIFRPQHMEPGQDNHQRRKHYDRADSQ